MAGPLLIVAGAGSGKTRALTYRIANLIAEGVVQPWQILAVTFTNKAAGEMRRRAEVLIEKTFGRFDPSNQPMIGTFHSVCVRILRRNFEKFGREKSFVIYDTIDTEGLMKRIIKEQKMDDEKLKPRTILSIISNAKNKLQEAKDFEAKAKRPSDKTIALLFKEYEKRLKQNNALDFDDLILFTVKLFREHPDVLDYYQERWRFINVDEYQDTNHAQYALTNLLASKYRNLCVIGDSDQSIYSFRGADIQNILDFEKDYPEAKLIKLEQNYRSTQPILDVADSIIDKNQNRKPKKMWTEKKEGDLIDIWHLDSEYHEAESIAKEMERLRSEDGVSLKDMVVLYRTNVQSRVLEEILLRFGLPYKVIGGVKFYARKEIKDILAYLRLVLNPYDTDSLLRIINVPSRKIGATTVNKLQVFAMSRSLTLVEVLKHVEMVSELNDNTKNRLSNFWKLIKKWQGNSEKMQVAELIKEIVKDIDYKTYLLDGTEEGEMRYDNIRELISVASKYDGLEPLMSLHSFLEEVALVADTDNLDQSEDVLTMMTLHSVKGLEYEYVFIVGCEENVFPHSRVMYDPRELEEERRLMYVGVTRAMKKLYLIAAKKRMLFGDFQSNALSRFIDDIPEELTNRIGIEKSFVETYQPTDFGFQKEKKVVEVRQTAEEKFKDGDKIKHTTFGDGIVVERRGDLVTVAFNNPLYGIKMFAANIAPLEKME